LFVAVAIFAMSGCGSKRPVNLVQSPEDIAGRIIGVLSGSPSARLADELGLARSYDSIDSLMENLKFGALDCILMENTVAAELVGEASGVKLIGEPMLEYDLRFAVAKENAELLGAVNSALAYLEGNGTLNGLRGKYFASKAYAYVPPENVSPHPGALILAVSADDRPFSYKDDSGVFCGLNIDVAVAVCDSLGVELQITGLDTGELITAVWYGKADLALGWLPGDVGDVVNLSESYAHTSHVIIVRE
jgi:ABC-type amino acid transport substrate-binding protein